MEMLKYEKEIMNMYVTDNPVRPYMPQLTARTKYNISQLAELDHPIPNGTFGGMISEISQMRTRRGKLMSKFKLEDTTGYIEAICFNHEKFANLIVEDNICIVKGKFEKGDRGDQIIVYEVNELQLDPNFVAPQQSTQEQRKPLEITLMQNAVSEDRIGRMNAAFQSNFGTENVFLYILQENGKKIKAQMPFKVKADSQVLKQQLSSIFEGKVEIN